MTNDQYVKATVDIVNALSTKGGMDLKSGKQSHKGIFSPECKPLLDIMDECGPELISR